MQSLRLIVGVILCAVDSTQAGAKPVVAKPFDRQSDSVTYGRLKASATAQPVIKLRKKLSALCTALSLGCDYHVEDRIATFDASWRDKWLGGDISLKNLGRVEWRKTWLLPGGQPCGTLTLSHMADFGPAA